jgi:hypothetical protein
MPPLKIPNAAKYAEGLGGIGVESDGTLRFMLRLVQASRPGKTDRKRDMA